MFNWLFRRRKPVALSPSVTEAIATRDKRFAEAKTATDAAKEAMHEADRVTRNILKDYEDAERARIGDA